MKQKFLKFAALLMMLFVSRPVMAEQTYNFNNKGTWEVTVDNDVITFNITSEGAAVSDQVRDTNGNYLSLTTDIAKVIIKGKKTSQFTITSSAIKAATEVVFDCPTLASNNSYNVIIAYNTYFPNVTKVTLTDKVVELPNRAFQNLKALSLLVIEKEGLIELPSSSAYCFYTSNSKKQQTGVEVKVPFRQYSQYKDNSVWKEWIKPENFSTDIILDDDTDLSNLAGKEFGRVYTISYTRNFKNTNWQALYLPFEVEQPEGLAFAKLFNIYENTEKTWLKFNDYSDNLNAYYPYLVQASEAGIYTFEIDNQGAPFTFASGENNACHSWCASTEKMYQLFGVYQRYDITEENIYALSAGTLRLVDETAGVHLNPFRWYVKVTDSNDGPYSNPNPAMIRVVTSDDEETSLEAIFDTENEQCNVYTINGQVITGVSSVEEFTKSDAPAGLYIINGKKIQKF